MRPHGLRVLEMLTLSGTSDRADLAPREGGPCDGLAGVPTEWSQYPTSSSARQEVDVPPSWAGTSALEVVPCAGMGVVAIEFEVSTAY
jgi:hypothetical protein